MPTPDPIAQAIFAAAQALDADDLAGAMAQICKAFASSTPPILVGDLTTTIQPAAGNWLARLQKQVEAYLQTGVVAAAAWLAKARRECADGWLNMTDAALPVMEAAGFGAIHDALMSGSRLVPIDEADLLLRQKVTQYFATTSTAVFNAPQAVGHFLAAMLYWPPHQLPFEVDPIQAIEKLPDFWRQAYVRWICALPGLFQEIGEADAYCEFMRCWVAKLHQRAFAEPPSPAVEAAVAMFAALGNFIGIYFNTKNLKDLYLHRAALMKRAIQRNGWRPEYDFGPRGAGGKIRLGILAAHFGPQTETYTTLPLYEHLDRTKFAIHLFAVQATGQPLERYCASRADSLVVLPATIPQQVDMIRQADLDVLIVGTNVTAVTNAIAVLALHRLARVQATAASSPTSTGMAEVDYYISGTLGEPRQNAQDYYKEKLVMIDGAAHCFAYRIEEPARINVSRAALNIASDAVVFASGANFFKIIPELRQAWARIVAGVPGSVLLLYPFGAAWSNTYAAVPFVNAMAQALAEQGVSSDRLVMLKMLSGRGDVQSCLKIADVYLDSFSFAGVNTTVDALQAGLPPVLMGGDGPLRTQWGAALLRSIDLPELVAADVEGFVGIAQRLGTDAEYRRQMARQVAQKMRQAPRFLDSRWYATQMAAVLEEMVAHWRQQHDAAAVL